MIENNNKHDNESLLSDEDFYYQERLAKQLMRVRTIFGIVVLLVSLVAGLLTISDSIPFSSLSKPIELTVWQLLGILSPLPIISYFIVTLYLRSEIRRKMTRMQSDKNEELKSNVSRLKQEREIIKQQSEECLNALKVKNKEEIRKIHSVAATIHKQYNKTLWHINSVTNDAQLSKFNTGNYEKDRVAFDAELDQIVEKIHHLYFHYLGHPVHVCIKQACATSNSGVTVYTRFRDNNNPERLGGNSDIFHYPYSDSTALKELIDNNENYYLRNKIPEDAQDYINPRKDWFKYYDSTLGVPIRADYLNSFGQFTNAYNKGMKFGKNGNAYGFIFLDTKGNSLNSKDGFDPHCVDLLINIGRHLFNFLNYDPMIEKRHKDSGGGAGSEINLEY